MRLVFKRISEVALKATADIPFAPNTSTPAVAFNTILRRSAALDDVEVI